MIAIVVAYDKNKVIGKGNDLPWYLPEDLKHFKTVTSGSTVIMGRKTYESILKRLGHALPNRRNIVISTKLNKVAEGFELSPSLEKAILASDGINPENEVYIIGGAQLYQSALNEDVVDLMYVTEVEMEVVGGDAWFPELDQQDWLEISRKKHKKDAWNPHDYSFVVMLRHEK